ncbi:hypothetical protein BDN72DRAFT_640445 [Pluteus cervinus]|uniref:Uncharacterized protein n=1 Tax=Pluteus cervinus TaxID=181527 RepID=A0ACD3AUR8_9AGAR|nr:hypothetical protein BDN72DRAFT_640445 [Pluteus cervinus]
MADVGEDDFVFPFGDVEDEVVHGLCVEHDHTNEDDVLFPFGDIVDEELKDLRRLGPDLPPSHVLQELPFAQWSKDLAPLTRISKTKAAVNGFTYEFNVYTPEANTTYNFIRAYFMITRRRENDYLKDSVRFIPRLPLDILSEVFKHLHPMDLYNIYIVDSSLKSLIKPIWKCVWESHPDIPNKPSTVTYPHWADLWFGPAECHRRVAQPDFTANKRYCTKCLSKRVQFLYDSGEDSILLSCSPIASRTNGYHIQGYRDTGSGWRFSPDLKHAKLRLAVFDNDIAGGVFDTSKEKDDYIKLMTTSAKARSVHADRCEKYAARIFDLYKAVKNGDLMKMIDRLKKRLVYKEGFTLNELGDLYIQLNQRWQQDSILTMSRNYLNRTWSTHILPTAHACKRAYHEVQQEQVTLRREQMIKVAYENYQKEQVKPEGWYMLPSPNTFVRMIRCREYAQNADEGEPQMEDCVELVKELEGELRAWFGERKKDVCATFLHDKKVWIDESPVVNGTEALGPKLDRPVDEMINLAVSVFSCYACEGKWFGWDAVSKHLCCRGLGNSSHVSYFLDIACWSVVRKLLEKLGLDHRVTTREDMDKLGYRFLCQLCWHTPSGYRRAFGRSAFDWRGFVRHMTNGEYHYGYGHEVNSDSWKILTPEAARYVQPREKRHPEREDPAWSCNHCAVHYNELVPYKSVLLHLKDWHGIKEATIGTDVIHIPHTYHTISSPVVVPVAPHNLRCLVCPEDKSVRTWFKEKTMSQHLRDRHGVIGDVQENQHWKIVDMFLP